jgi:hypothetical protein
MTSFFGPETPRPFCIVSEQQMKYSLDKIFKDNELKHDFKRKTGEWSELDYFSSKDYENKVCYAINKYLDIDCLDQILYIRAKGDEDPKTNNLSGETSYVDLYSNHGVKDWSKIFEDKYALIKPVDVGEISLLDEVKFNAENEEELSTSLDEQAMFKLKFIEQKNTTKKYDKIIIKNCLKCFDNNYQYFSRFILDYFKNTIQKDTSLLIIQQVCDLSTLPFYSRVNKEWQANDVKYTSFMNALQNEFYTLKYDIEMFDYLIDCKSSWYTNLKKKSIYPLNQNSMLVDERAIESRKELVHGLRELNEGVFKYQPIDNYVELCDRLLFIGAHHVTDRKFELARRLKSSKQAKKTTLGNTFDTSYDIKLDNEIRQLYMEITPDIRHHVNSIDKFKYSK